MFEAIFGFDAQSKALLDSFGDLITDEIKDEAALAGAEVIKKDAEKRVERGPSKKFNRGHLQDAFVAKNFKKRGESQAFVATDYSVSKLGHLYEYGTAVRKHKNGKFVGIMPAKAPLRKATDAKQDEAAKAMEETLIKGIEKKLGEKL